MIRIAMLNCLKELLIHFPQQTQIIIKINSPVAIYTKNKHIAVKLTAYVIVKLLLSISERITTLNTRLQSN